MPIFMTLFRALFWVALPVIGAACAGVYCSEHTRRDLARDRQDLNTVQDAKQPVTPGVHFPDA